MRRTLLATLIATPLIAQDAPPKLTAASFLPEGHETILHLDLKAFRDRGVWEEIERSVLAAVLRRIEERQGFPLERLDRVRAYACLKEGQPLNLYLLEGNAELVLRAPEGVPQAWREDAVGPYTVFQENPAMGGAFHVQPHPRLLVHGNRELVLPTLEGKAPNGRPSADVLSLLSGRGDNLLYLVIHVADAETRQVTLERVLDHGKWPEDDAPTHLMLRVRTTGDPEDPHLELEAVLRHARGKDGLQVSEDAVRAWLERLQTDRQLGALKALWQSIELRRDGRDLVARKDLGRLRQSIGTLATLLAPMMPR